MKFHVPISFVFAVMLATSAHAKVEWAFVGPMTGPMATYGDVTLLGAQAALDDYNKTQVQDDQQIVLKIFDTVCDPKQSVAIANRIIASNIHYVIEGDCSGSSIASEKIYSDENIVVVNAAASNPKFTNEGGPTIFRTSYRDDHVAPQIIDVLTKKFAHTKLAILHDNSTYGTDIAALIRDGVHKVGIKETLFDHYDERSRDHSAMITRLKQSNIDCLFMGVTDLTSAAALVRQIHEAGLHIQIVGGDLSDPAFWEVAGEGAEGALFVLPHSHRNDPDTSNLTERLDKMGKVYNEYTFQAYVAGQVLTQSFRDLPHASSSEIAAHMHQTPFQTIFGRSTFDGRGDIQGATLALHRWHQGSYVEIKE